MSHATQQGGANQRAGIEFDPAVVAEIRRMFVKAMRAAEPSPYVDRRSRRAWPEKYSREWWAGALAALDEVTTP